MKIALSCYRSASRDGARRVGCHGDRRRNRSDAWWKASDRFRLTRTGAPLKSVFVLETLRTPESGVGRKKFPGWMWQVYFQSVEACLQLQVTGRPLSTARWIAQPSLWQKLFALSRIIRRPSITGNDSDKGWLILHHLWIRWTFQYLVSEGFR